MAGKQPMSCPFEKVYAAEFSGLKEDLHDLKARVGRLESVLVRGMVLLVANLLGVIVTLAKQLI